MMYQLVLEQLTLLRREQRDGFESMRSEFNGRIDRLVTQEAFSAEQRRADGRFDDLSRGLIEEREARIAADKIGQLRDDKFAANLRWTAAAILLPIILWGGNLVVASGGGA